MLRQTILAPSLNILVTGASGLIGSAFCAAATGFGQRVVKLRRSPSVPGDPDPSWNPARGEVDWRGLEGMDAVVHLAGETVAQRWSQASRARIRQSREFGTRRLVEALWRLPNPPSILVCASATGFYGDRGDELLDEQSLPGTGFLAEVCQAWEAATFPAVEQGARVVHLRFGVVLSSRGGALAKMLLPFRLGLGGKLGTGRQYWSWIALEDAVGVILHALRTDALRGPVNAVSPHPVTNREFTRVLGAVLGRPTFLPVPGFLIRLGLGEMGREILLAGGRVSPRRLEETGFGFEFPRLEAALRHSLRK